MTTASTLNTRAPTSGRRVGAPKRLAVAALAMTAASVGAQCGPQWEAVTPGLSRDFNLPVGVGSTLRWDPDGVGPALPVLLVSGRFDWAGAYRVPGFAAYEPVSQTWSRVGMGPFWPGPFSANAMVEMANGDLVVTGLFTQIGGVPAKAIARWDGTSWSELGGGLSGGFAPQGYGLDVLPNGDLIVGGDFTMAGSVPVSNVARWDGSSWHALGSGVAQLVRAVAAMPNGDVLTTPTRMAGGVPIHGIGRWDGASWSSLGAGVGGPTGGSVAVALRVLPNGDLIAGGTFTTAGGQPARRIARWDGSSWSAFGVGVPMTVWQIAQTPDGDLLAAGADRPGNIYRWNGSAWSDVLGGVDSYVYGLVPWGDGVYVAGGFTAAGGVPVNGLARLTTTCPASATPIVTSCVGPTGPLTLTAVSAPWVGTTLRTTATGFGPTSLGAAAFGLHQQSLPMVQLHPAGLPNCDLLATTEALVLAFPVAGTAGAQLVIPNDPVFAGVKLFHQFLQADFGPQGSIQSLSGSNGLELTIGVF